MQNYNKIEEKDINKSQRVISIFKNLIFWLIVILFFEFSYRISMNFSFDIDSVINIILYGMTLSATLSMISRIFNDRVNNCIVSIVLLSIGVLFSIQCVFTKIFTTNISLSNLALGDQAAGFIDEALERNTK